MNHNDLMPLAVTLIFCAISLTAGIFFGGFLFALVFGL